VNEFSELEGLNLQFLSWGWRRTLGLRFNALAGKQHLKLRSHLPTDDRQLTKNLPTGSVRNYTGNKVRRCGKR
jgi:hypothetical protein